VGTLPPVPAPSAIEVRGLEKSFGRAQVLHGIDLDVDAGGILALLGPSGCGKTTLLRTLAGLEAADAGTIRVGGELVDSPAGHRPPERRGIGMVFQDWALFPHLDVGRNVGYGLPRGRSGGAAARIEAALALVGLPGLAARMPATLSGGQQQRVALARAIAPQPSILLLDEPFSNLDSTLRVQVRTEVHALLVELGVTAVFVTHDQEEAFVLGDRVAVMLDGRIVQEATPAELYARPATPWLAGFVGDANLLEATASRGTARTAVGPVRVDRSVKGACTVLVRPEALTLDAKGSATVELVEYQGHDTAYVVRIDDDTTVRVRLSGPPRHARGDAVAVSYSGEVAAAYLPG
jgi:iron(III) transport system ATP-binding protein